MDILDIASGMLEKYPLCDNCLGRQFALLGHGVENDDRGRAIKLVLTLRAHSSKLSGNNEDLKSLKSLALNGFFSPAKELLDQLGLSIFLH